MSIILKHIAFLIVPSNCHRCIYIRVMDPAGNAGNDEFDCLEGDNTLRPKIFYIYIDIIVYREYG
jgi:hypothetical protein